MRGPVFQEGRVCLTPAALLLTALLLCTAGCRSAAVSGTLYKNAADYAKDQTEAPYYSPDLGWPEGDASDVTQAGQEAKGPEAAEDGRKDQEAQDDLKAEWSRLLEMETGE